MEGNLDLAREYLERSLRYDADNVRSLQVLAITYRQASQAAKARENRPKFWTSIH